MSLPTRRDIAADCAGLLGREEKSKRTRSGKTYTLSAGQHEAVLFASPVHFIDSHNNWQEIDNTLIEKGNALCTAASDVCVSLKTSEEDELIAINYGPYRLSWRLEETKEVKPAVVPVKHEKLPPRFAFIEKLESRAEYIGIKENTDLFCCITPDGFKESIVFSDYSAAKPLTFWLNVKGLSLLLNKDGSIQALNDEKKTLFVIPAPYLYDSNEKIKNGEVYVNLTKQEEKYCLVYTPDEEYMKQAVYPVTLDPVVVYSDKSRTSADMTWIDADQPDMSFGTTGASCPVSTNSPGVQKKIMCVRYKQNELPEIDSSYYVTKAYASFYYSEAPSRAAYLHLYENPNDWEADSITYNNSGFAAMEKVPLDYVYLTPNSPEGYAFDYDISNLVRKWYTGINNGFYLSLTEYCSMRVQSICSSYRKPYMTIQYVSLAGTDDAGAYETQSCGRAGEGAVSLFNGNLVFSHPDTSMNGNLMPVSLTHYYNSCYHGVSAYKTGYGWKLSSQQTLHLEKIANSSGTLVDYYVYTDADGSRHHFKNSSGKWKDLSGLALELTLDTGAQTATIKNKGDCTMQFPLPTEETEDDYSNVCFITQEHDAVNTSVTYETDSTETENIIITDGAGRVTTLYGANTLLQGIRAPYMNPSGNEEAGVSFAYTDGKLTSITDEEGKTCNYTYDENNLLVKVQNYDGLTVEYTYEGQSITAGGVTTVRDPFRVTKVRTYKQTNTGRTYISERKYDYKDCLTVVLDRIPRAEITEDEDPFEDGKRLFYHFNDYGNAVSVNDELGFGAFAEYSDDFPVNHPESLSKLQRIVSNLVRNHNFVSTGSTVWTSKKIESASGTAGYSTEQNYTGGYSYKLYKSTTEGRMYVEQTIVGWEAGGQYTYSAYVRTSASAVKAQLKAVLVDADGIETEIENEAVKSLDKWTRIHVSFTVPEGTESVKIRAYNMGGRGSLYVDAVQLEKGLLLNRYNLLVNGAFSAESTGHPEKWSCGSGITDADTVKTVSSFSYKPSSLTGNILYLKGQPGTDKMLSQNLNRLGKQGDVYVLGGWAASRTRPRSTGGQFRLELFARRSTTDGTTPSFTDIGYTEWSEEWSDWQFAARPIIMPWKYSALGVRIRYKNNINEAEFADLFLYKEEFGHTYRYDSNGNVTSVKNLASLQSGTVYDDYNNLTSYRRAGYDSDIKYTLSYGSTTAQKKQHLVKQVKSPLGTYTKTQYDVDNAEEVSPKGLPVRSLVCDASTPTKFIQTETEYTADRNYTAAQHDARGKTVTTVTDTNKGTTVSVTDPNGQTVQYAYDTMRRNTEVRTETGESSERQVYLNTYGYTNDKLTKIAHNTDSGTIPEEGTAGDTSVRYHFGYDDAGRETTVKVGLTESAAQTLSENEYNRDGTLNRVIYGNGSSVRYDYDAFKRVTGICFDSETEERYSFEFLSGGQTGRVYDRLLHRVATSAYDTSERPVSITYLENAQDTEGGFDVNTGDHLYTGAVSYNGQNSISEFSEKIGQEKKAYATNFTYDNEGRPTVLKYGDDTHKVNYTYDKLGRITKRKVTNSGALTTDYSYLEGGYPDSATVNKSTTSLISGISQGNETFTYTYDDVGNIMTATRGTGTDAKTTTYEYDALGQLIRVNDPHDVSQAGNGATWTYGYDMGGNILEKKRYAYTEGEIQTEAEEATTYTYGNAQWKDQLTGITVTRRDTSSG